MFGFALWNKHRIQINYKSGISMKMWVRSWTLRTRDGDISEFSWHLRSADNRIILVGMESIESIHRLKYLQGLFGEKSLEE